MPTGVPGGISLPIWMGLNSAVIKVSHWMIMLFVSTWHIGFYFWLRFKVVVCDFDMCHCQTDEIVKLCFDRPSFNVTQNPIQVLPKLPSPWLPKEYSQLPLD